jgi:precorrin-2 dehydrogenase / sirohydrochlorin ferrochelatase
MVPMTTSDSYLAGLRLEGRRVVVVGAGRVAERRLERLLEARAGVELIAPEATAGIRRMQQQRRVTWTERAYRDGDLDGAWYVLAATDDPDCNRRVSAEAERRRIFCVRADDRAAATAWTPATGVADGVQVGVLAGGDHGRSRRIRDRLLGLVVKIIAHDRSRDDEERAA